MIKSCPHCLISRPELPEGRTVRFGRFRRTSDGQTVSRFRCLDCRRTFSNATFSNATFSPCYRQKKRQFNDRLRKHFASGLSQRRAAILFNLARRTVERKFVFVGKRAVINLEIFNRSLPPAKTVHFDDMETFEHTKMKPLSITVAVVEKTRRILGVQVSQMPAKGLLAKKSRAKYGPRKDERRAGRQELFRQLLPLVQPEATFKSDQNPHYPADLKEFFPFAKHVRFKGRKPRDQGLGELKKGGYDPLFPLNHTCAMKRSSVNRLFRKTWNTTKKATHLAYHLAIYADFHNRTLIKA